MTGRRRPSLLLALPLALVAGAAVAAPADAVRLFNGKDLSGWTHVLVDPKVRMEEVWSVRDGVLVCRGERTRGARLLKDVRPMAVLSAAFLRHGFVRIHRDYLVNPRHVRRVRRRARGDDWEVTLDPPVTVVLPVSRSGLAALWGAFGED